MAWRRPEHDLGFNRSMQHSRNCVSKRSVADEAKGVEQPQKIIGQIMASLRPYFLVIPATVRCTSIPAVDQKGVTGRNGSRLFENSKSARFQGCPNHSRGGTNRMQPALRSEMSLALTFLCVFHTPSVEDGRRVLPAKLGPALIVMHCTRCEAYQSQNPDSRKILLARKA
jgi:hypothetical protein